MSLVAAGLAAAALAVAAAPASALTFSFDPGAASPSDGYTVINDFVDATGITGVNFQIKVPPSDSNGAFPANSAPAGSSYLSVLGGGIANIDFGGAFKAFQFDWGSIDGYNTLTIHSSAGDFVVVPGVNFPNAANGNQFAPGTNGLFKVRGGSAAETFTGITLSSGQNSFEIDRVAVSNAVPEPATWAMMIIGFGAAGSMIRRRRAVATAA